MASFFPLPDLGSDHFEDSPGVAQLSFAEACVKKLEEAERRIRRGSAEEDAVWLSEVLRPGSATLGTLVHTLLSAGPCGDRTLLAQTLRAVQLALTLAMATREEPKVLGSETFGMACFDELAGDWAHAVFPVLIAITESCDDLAACSALLVLKELGPEAMQPRVAVRTLELMVALPTQAAALAEVAPCMHAWGGQFRIAILSAIVGHSGGKLLLEVLLQMFNRGDGQCRLQVARLFGGCVAAPGSEDLFYANDIRILVEILCRELLASADDATSFTCYTDLLRALARRYPVAREHQRQELIQAFCSLLEDDRLSRNVHDKASDMIEFLTGVE